MFDVSRFTFDPELDNVKIMVHSSYEFADVDSKGIAAGKGMEVKIGVDATVIQS